MHDSTLPQFARLAADFVSPSDAVPAHPDPGELRRFSKVVDPRPVCLAPLFAAFNRSDVVAVSFDAPHHAPPPRPDAPPGGAAPDARPSPQWQAPMPLQDWSAYFVPYAILSLAVVALIAIALRSRRDRMANKRMPV